MTRLADAIASTEVPPDSLAVFWLGQAGFAFKTSGNQLIFVDAYLSDMCETTLGGGVMAKRLMPPPMEAHEITRGLMAATHVHADHLDEESIALVARSAPAVSFAGPVSCIRRLRELGIAEERLHLLAVGTPCEFEGFSLRAVYADHGAAEPHAVGMVLEADGIRAYHTGDTSYCPARMREVMTLKPEIIIPCINGTFGNLTAPEAARLANDVRARVAIPSHFWLFAMQNTSPEGTPAAFLESCAESASATTPMMLRVAEPFLYRKGAWA